MVRTPQIGAKLTPMDLSHTPPTPTERAGGPEVDTERAGGPEVDTEKVQAIEPPIETRRCTIALALWHRHRSRLWHRSRLCTIALALWRIAGAVEWCCER